MAQQNQTSPTTPTSAAPVSDLPTELPPLRQIPGVDKQLVVTASPVAPKNGEQSIIRLKDGSLFFVWSEFIRVDLMPEGERPPESPLRRNPTGDDGYARICGKVSQDGGKTWSEPRVVVDDRDALVNCICPGLARAADGRLMIAYSWRSGGNGADNFGNCSKMVRFSNDEGQTWSERMQITPDDGGYHTGCHDRSYTLSNGRLIVHCHTIFKPGIAQPGKGYRRTCMGSYYAYSDDNGQNWQRCEVIKDPLVEYGGRFEEASLAQRRDGSLVQFIRSWHGQSFISESTDHGSTWSAPKPSGVFSALAPSLVVPIPNSNDLLMVWNPTWNPDEPIAGLRSPLALAISQDGGHTWGLPKALETHPDYWWEYPSVFFDGDHALIYYRAFPSNRKRCDLIQATVPLSWLYQRADWQPQAGF